jgi:hypothetical protein
MPVGAPGVVAGVTLTEAADAGLVPEILVAVTVHVTATPLVSGLTTIGEPDPFTPTAPHVARKPVIGLPPLLVGGVNATETWAFPAVATPMVGAPGALIGATGVTLAESAEAGLVPTPLVAFTLQVTAVPFGSGLTMMGEPGPVTVTLPHVAL